MQQCCQVGKSRRPRTYVRTYGSRDAISSGDEKQQIKCEKEEGGEKRKIIQAKLRKKQLNKEKPKSKIFVDGSSAERNER